MSSKGKCMEKLSDSKFIYTTREIRLHYYNDYLYSSGVITKREHDKMFLAIISYCSKGQKSSK